MSAGQMPEPTEVREYDAAIAHHTEVVAAQEVMLFPLRTTLRGKPLRRAATEVCRRHAVEVAGASQRLAAAYAPFMAGFHHERDPHEGKQEQLVSYEMAKLHYREQQVAAARAALAGGAK